MWQFSVALSREMQGQQSDRLAAIGVAWQAAPTFECQALHSTFAEFIHSLSTAIDKQILAGHFEVKASTLDDAQGAPRKNRRIEEHCNQYIIKQAVALKRFKLGRLASAQLARGTPTRLRVARSSGCRAVTSRLSQA